MQVHYKKQANLIYHYNALKTHYYLQYYYFQQQLHNTHQNKNYLLQTVLYHNQNLYNNDNQTLQDDLIFVLIHKLYHQFLQHRFDKVYHQ